MKKLIVLFTAVIFFSVLLTLNVTINDRYTNINLGGEKLKAEMIPCSSNAKRNLNHAYVDCDSCNRLTGWRSTGHDGQCDNSEVGVSDN